MFSWFTGMGIFGWIILAAVVAIGWNLLQGLTG
jgi:hypothetical protein